MASSPFLPLFLLFLSHLSSTSSQKLLSNFSIANSPWRPNQRQILISPYSTFASGFRTLPSSPNLYIFAIWYRNSSDQTIIWSSNPQNPINRSALLTISPSGVLSLNDSTSGNLLRGNPAGKSNSSSELILTENGNLVFHLWSSFNFPTDTILPTQPFNPNQTTTLISRRNSNSYSFGKFEFRNSKSLVFNSTDNYWTSDFTFKNFTVDGTITKDNAGVVISADRGAARLRRLTLDVDGNLRIYSLDPSSRTWTMVWQAIQNLCEIHGSCGPNYVCQSNGSNTTTCICPAGFRRNENGDCVRKIPLSTNLFNSKFLRLDFVNFSGGSNQTDLKPTNISICQSTCLTNPNCLGFAYKYDGTQYCVHQIDRLFNGYWAPGTGVAFFLRVHQSESDVSNFTGMTSMLDTVCPVQISLPLPPKQSNTTTRNLAIICSLFALELISGVLSFWAFLRRYSKYRDMARTFGLELLPAGGPKRFSYAELKSATKDFSNIVGHGGFGIVYRGELPDHRIIAVKRLKNVAGGEAEFWAEVTIIARMHHLNLVRLWGFCAEKGQRMLVYEYIRNGSLDKFLFAPASIGSKENSDSNSQQQLDRPLLDWNIRYRIAVGVARAIAYLHEECLEWVLHCDIKPENILLEDDFCPKVSDFGLAKLSKKEDIVSMSRIRGTRGYLAPEWVKTEEPITAKADVYSFGMVLLEIVSGIRNFEFRRSSLGSEDWYFPRWVYQMVCKEKKVEEILDRRILDQYNDQLHSAMVDRMVKTAMWCLQDRPELRPSMGKVAKMLEGTVEIMEPAKPRIFYLEEAGDDAL
ncbi:G-type lectin S-receptor-like serine/threonine-protein kinase At5g24080 [Tasmannia lanceolata]|uniref:G-type lectin S-receptor-like serine/threonine-protein kinase At5g24080 n=1 Tax=Tasmannia lanceolata TaxID=3420 RepID=UPI004062B4FB